MISLPMFNVFVETPEPIDVVAAFVAVMVEPFTVKLPRLALFTTVKLFPTLTELFKLTSPTRTDFPTR